ncbi:MULTISPECIES: hypothetical protein [unclassified Enterobacter]|uniref:hypothetical protein n=1 Tax=unclassified Enterobacter TaxID=2608935 RepID=UPI0003ED0BB7|nr:MULTISPECIES: hypothetical protein [unclassified Enterobacter]EWG66827.1 Lipopolysaccharide core biosynthesis protein RfaS [Enterobacter sp. DC3]EWG73518.1 Lipopolysaccharide core biosynthesis protein RfaS [Enterobacter sp. DC4]
MRYYFLEWVNDFEIMMLNSLAKDYPVMKINRIMRRYKSVNAFMPGTLLKKWHKRFHCAVKLSAIKPDDIVICNGYSVFPFLDYIASMPCKKVLILRDSVVALTRKRRLLGQLTEDEDYIEKVRPVFDVIFSFDSADCQRYNLAMIEQFLPFSLHEIQRLQKESQSENKSCFFVGGYEPVRAETLKIITPELENNGYSPDFYLLDKYNNQDNYPDNCQNKRLSYIENIEKVKHAAVLLEINKPEQQGLTLRALEALIFNKKLITTNVSIRSMDLYDPARIFIYNEDDIEGLRDFLQSPLPNVDETLLSKYSADSLIKTLQKVNF